MGMTSPIQIITTGINIVPRIVLNKLDEIKVKYPQCSAIVLRKNFKEKAPSSIDL
jgi:hypothetical protein